MSSAPFDPTPFGRYELTERLAVGGMAEIFRAKSRGAHGFEKTLVIKRILPHLAEDKGFVEMFIDEAKLMSRLNHPKIVQVLDFGEFEGQYFMALEHIDGVDGLAMLRQCAKRRCRPTTGIALYIIADLLDALDFAHNLKTETGAKLGLVHRDISPSNLFISWLGEVKLGDFGIARASLRRGHHTETGALKGKYGYMAPEQVSDEVVDHRADIFAVGVVLAEFLMIRRLFYSKNDLDVLLQVRDANLRRLDRFGSHVPPGLRTILESALSRDPRLRYQTASAFRDALHRYLYEQRRMVRSQDVRNFLLRLIGDDRPLPGPVGESVEMPLNGTTPGRKLASQQQALESSTQYSAVGRGDRLEVPPKRKSSPELERALEAEAEANRANKTPTTAPDPELAARGEGDLFPPTQASYVGRKRRIMLTPPPMALPVPTGLPHTGEEPRLRTEDALAAVPEMAADGSDDSGSYSGFDRKSKKGAELPEGPTLPVDVESTAVPLAASDDEIPQLEGELAERSLFNLLFKLAVEETTGLVLLESRDVQKQVFLVDGDPQYVTSNRTDELFGQYLINRGVLSKGELSMALAMLPHFDGKLGDSLVALKLLRPVEVLRHLTYQVRQKLLDTFEWEGGHYRFYADKMCNFESAPLGLDAFEIIGAAVKMLPAGRIAKRLQPLQSQTLRAVSPPLVPPELFRLGAFPREVYDKLDGRNSLRELLSRFDDRTQRERFAQIVFLFQQTDMVTTA